MSLTDVICQEGTGAVSGKVSDIADEGGVLVPWQRVILSQLAGRKLMGIWNQPQLTARAPSLPAPLHSGLRRGLITTMVPWQAAPTQLGVVQCLL